MTEEIPKHVTSRAKLALLLGGVHRDTIARWEKEEGAPPYVTGKGYDVKAWIDFAELITKRSKVQKTSRKQELEMEKLSETVRKLKMDNDESDGKLIRVDDAKQTITVLVSEVNGLIRTIEDSLPQAMQGLSIPDQRIVIRRFFDEMRVKINNGAEAVA